MRVWAHQLFYKCVDGLWPLGGGGEGGEGRGREGGEELRGREGRKPYATFTRVFPSCRSPSPVCLSSPWTHGPFDPLDLSFLTLRSNDVV